jgi:uncharacterized RDD family membrane protein YckC
MVGALGAGALIAIGAVDIARWFEPSPDLPHLEAVAVELFATRGNTARDWMVLWIPFVLYHAIAGGTRRATLGAFVTGLSVVGPDGHLASTSRGCIRGVLYLLWPLTGLLAAMWSFVSPSQRGLHDLFSRSWVIRDPARLNSSRTK